MILSDVQESCDAIMRGELTAYICSHHKTHCICAWRPIEKKSNSLGCLRLAQIGSYVV